MSNLETPPASEADIPSPCAVPAPNTAPNTAPDPAPAPVPASIQDADELHGEDWGSLGPLQPDESCEPVTEDRGVLKKILTEGLGDTPQPFSRCLVHYIGRLQTRGTIFLDTKTESQSRQPVRITAGRHTSPKETGLNLGVATMRMGERAMIYIQDPKYGYGEAGSFSFPAVPPQEALTYEVECVDFETNQEDEGGDVSGLLYEERLERAEKRRMIGNQLFGEGRFKEALGKYAVALSYMDEDFMMQLEGFYETKAFEVKVPIHLNMAACQLRIKDFHTAVYNCGEVLKIQPENAKAFFRRGTARHALGQTEGALEDLQRAVQLAPDDKAIAKELMALKATLKAERAAQAKLFKGAFKPSPSTMTAADRQQGSGPPVSEAASQSGRVVQVQASRGWLAWAWAIMAGMLAYMGLMRKR